MTQPFQNLDELRELLDALCEETITPGQRQRLEELVLAHPEAEAYYVQYMSLYADLAGHFVGLPGAAEESLRGRIARGERERGERAGGGKTETVRERRSGFLGPLSPRLLVWGGLAAVAAGLLVILLLPRHGAREGSPPADANAERMDNSVAVLLQSPGAEWEEAPTALRPGAPLSPGRLRLKSGFALIQFYSGASVILQGPADFRLLSSNEAYCAAGKLRATVPPQAEGFTIGSPRLDLVDRGTEFGLEVKGTGKTEVHVFQGKVDLYDAGSNRAAASRRELTTGRGLSLDGPGAARPIESDPAAFLSARELAERSEEGIRRRQEEWLAASTAVRQDPSLVVYYPFQAGPAWNRTLPDQAGGRLKPHDGAIVGCTWAVGRWPGKQGLEFKRVSDRVRFHVPGTFESLTLMAWVRVDALTNRFNSLMLTDGWDEGAPHWHISGEGTLELGVQGPNRKGGVHYYAPRAFTPDRLGQWTHLAVVYDRDAGYVTHYLDGQPIREEPIKLDIKLRLGDAEVGNWNVASHRNASPVRYFTGCIDEFLLYSRALSGQEIERLYQQGRPPP